MPETIEEERSRRVFPPHKMRPWALPRTTSASVESLKSEVMNGDASACARFTERLGQEGTPLIEDDDDPDWKRFTFLWQGEAPYGVLLQLNRLTDPLDPEDTQLEQLVDTDVYTITLRLPADWQGSYTFSVLPHPLTPTLHGRPDRQMLRTLAENAQPDSFARLFIPSKPTIASEQLRVPDYAVARGPRAPELQLWKHRTPAFTRLTDVTSPVNNVKLPLYAWSSPKADHRSPVVLFLDGEVWREQFPIAAEFAQRLSETATTGIHLLFLDSQGPVQRQVDYTCTKEESGVLLERIRNSAATIGIAHEVIITGQSLGGLFSMLCATRHHDRIRAAVAQSPSLWWPSTDSPWQCGNGWFEEQAAQQIPGAPTWIESGALDAGIDEPARQAAALLQTRGALLKYRRHAGGHDVVQWQAMLPDAIQETIRRTATARTD
jgi:enterochelin esterase-like enzyme